MNDPDTVHTRDFAKPRAKQLDESDLPPPAWKKLISLNTVGVLLMLGACCWSLYRVSTIPRSSADGATKDGEVVLRIAHWQLEAGFRDALDEVIKDYQALHPERKITILQQAVTEKVYSQWLNVNLIAGTPPDIAEMGRGLSEKGDSVAKYYIPLGREIGEINPYNAEKFIDREQVKDPELIKRLSTAPWRETLIDGMRGGWQDALQDYYAIPTSIFTVRMFYNKDMIKAATGSDEPPRSLAQFIAACDSLRAYALEQVDKKNKEFEDFNPIAAAGYHRSMFVNKYRIPFTHGYQDVADLDLSCDISRMESWIAWQTGRAKVGDPAYSAYLTVCRRICDQFNVNFSAMGRDQAIAAFAQRRAGFMASGSWDAASIFLACDFPVGIFNFPMPAPNEEFGEYGRYPLDEASTGTGCSFGIPKTCPNKELALDFLRFLTSQKWGGKFNELNGFLPITIGTAPSERMEEFMPNPYGVLAHLNFDDGYDLATKISGLLDKYLSKEIPLNEFDESITKLFAGGKSDFNRIWYKTWEKTVDNCRSLERTITVLGARELLGIGSPEDASRRRETILDQSLLNQGGNIRLLHAQNIGGTFPETP